MLHKKNTPKKYWVDFLSERICFWASKFIKSFFILRKLDSRF
ncbi:unnamed protein product [Spirodela intermedia]|uniref:Uncharacterized protein n=1 Tax=Spirodela intermedia TaxID=51605 RepID=A0A7I8JX34_SPIIN|nr:unnamed protein product [Spirodela intermedia]